MLRLHAAGAAAVILMLAGIAAQAPAAPASAGRAASPAQPKLTDANAPRPPGNGYRQRPVKLPPTVSVGNGPDGEVTDPATHTLYTSNQNDSSVSVVNTAHCHAGDTAGCAQHVHSVSLPAGASPEGIAIEVATGTLYVANIGNNTISVVNARTCNAVEFSGCGQAPANGATCDGTDTTGCGTTPPVIPGVGRAPNGIALDQMTHTVYTANAFDATVSVVNVTRRAIRHPSGQPPRVAVGSAPEAIAIDHGNHTIYVADTFDGTISILPGQPVRAAAYSPEQPARLWAPAPRPGPGAGPCEAVITECPKGSLEGRIRSSCDQASSQFWLSDRHRDDCGPGMAACVREPAP